MINILEIEKRYKINDDIPIPEDKIKSKKHITQVYSNINPDVRIRKLEENGETNYFHTVKYKTEDKNSRIEIEQLITQQEYKTIFDLIDKKPVIKDRYIVDLDNNLTAEIDHFLDTNDKIVEVEFPDEKTMNDFNNNKPDWFGDEIKGKQSFSVQVFKMINSNDIYSIIRDKYSL